MIDAKNLRVGNWVSINGKNVKVESIVEEDGINQSIEGDYYGGWVTEYEGYFNDWYKNEKNTPQGISLSPELLIKCRFEKRNGYNFDLGDIRLHDMFDGKDNDCEAYLKAGVAAIYIKNIKYLHDLQNLYWCLTQKELEVNL